jgi:hypothetical protein
MSNHEEPQDETQDQDHDEPVILSLEAHRNSLPDDKPPEPTDGKDAEGKDPKADEADWAGRNHAMRRSARWAA